MDIPETFSLMRKEKGFLQLLYHSNPLQNKKILQTATILQLKLLITVIYCVRYRESLQFADFGGNENPRIAKPQITRPPSLALITCPIRLF